MNGFSIELKCLYLTPEAEEKQKRGEEIGEEDNNYFLRPVTFYNIDTIAPNRHKGSIKTHSMVFSGNDAWVTPVSYEDLRAMVEERFKLINK